MEEVEGGKEGGMECRVEYGGKGGRKKQDRGIKGESTRERA